MCMCPNRPTGIKRKRGEEREGERQRERQRERDGNREERKMDGGKEGDTAIQKKIKEERHRVHTS